jgi:hypothetical protein
MLCIEFLFLGNYFFDLSVDKGLEVVVFHWLSPADREARATDGIGNRNAVLRWQLNVKDRA